MTWEILYIPGRPESSVQSTVNVLAADIEPRYANTLIRKLNQLAPLESFRHVKRVRKKIIEGKAQLSVILCLSSEKDEEVNILKDVSDLIKAYDLHPYAQKLRDLLQYWFHWKIPEYAARSREEWEEQCKFWPTSFHPPTDYLIGISGFSDDDSEMVFHFMKNAINLAKHDGNQVTNTAVIVDSSIREVICTARDETFVCCNAEQNSAFGNALDSSKCNSANHDEQSSCFAASCMYPWGWATHNSYKKHILQKDGLKYKWHPLRHAALVAIECASVRDRNLFPYLSTEEGHSSPVDCFKPSTISFSPKRQKTNTTSEESKDTTMAKPILNDRTAELTRPYLCTGFDIYLVWEPCTMCAMALVHQRIKRIFYALPNPTAGALGSVHRLQGERSLNHHYAVFRVKVPDEVIFNTPGNGTT